MSSFNKKKFSLILLILATLIIASSLTSVSGANADISLAFSTGSSHEGATYGENKTIFGAITNSSSDYNGSTNGDLVLFYENAMGVVDLRNVTIRSNFTANVTTPQTFNYTLNTTLLNRLGVSLLYVGFVPTNGSNLTASNSSIISLSVRSELIVTFDTDPANLRVGQEANFIGRVQGLDWNNTSKGLINLTNIVVYYTLANGTSANAITDVNGTFTIPQYIVPNTNFIINTTTDIFASSSTITGYLDQYYMDVSTSHQFSAPTLFVTGSVVHGSKTVEITTNVIDVESLSIRDDTAGNFIYTAEFPKFDNNGFLRVTANEPFISSRDYSILLRADGIILSTDGITGKLQVNPETLTKSPVNVTFNADPANIRVGQAANITGVVRGLLGVPLVNVTLYYTFANAAQSVQTDVNGIFTIPIAIVLSSSINISYATSVRTNPDLPSLYEDVSGSHVVNARIGKIDPVLWWCSGDQGYMVGKKFTVYWNLTNAGDLAGTNIIAWIVLFDYDNPDKMLRRFIVDLYNPTTINGVTSDGHYNFTEFILPHDRLVARLVIDGRDSNTFLTAYETSYGEAETFVYEMLRFPVKVSYLFTNVTVGKNYQFAINVSQRLAGFPVIDSGFVRLLFDGLYEFIVPVSGGVALFNHTFTQYKLNRFVEVNYLANPDIYLNSSPKEKQIFSAFQGTPVAIAAQLPNHAASFVGATNTIEVLISGLAAAADAAPKNLTLEFVSGGKCVRTETLKIIPDADFVLADGTTVFNVTASATIQFKYLYTHSPVIIRAVINDPKGNYKNTTSNTLNVVVVL